jgi:EAL domain-containing protein (putative c-di-GMP-specific phosphodiesterase class I)
LRQACQDAVTWRSDIRVAVNVSPAQFRHAGLIDMVFQSLAASGLAPSRLELEITENVLLTEHTATLAIMHKLRGIGVRVVMDDFGTGHSSIGYLRSFPFDKIKIDRSFIASMSTDASSLAIIRAVAGLGGSLGIATTAEGVETEEALAGARLEGCTEVQGFLFRRATCVSEIANVLTSTSERAVNAA